MTAVHQQLPLIRRPEGWQWRCSCGTRGPLNPDRDTARRSFILHREQAGERIQ